jgi:hypothetical protein
MTFVADREGRAFRRFKKAIKWIAAILTLGASVKRGVDEMKK